MSKQFVVFMVAQVALTLAFASPQQKAYAAPAKPAEKTSSPGKKSKSTDGGKRKHKGHHHEPIPSFRSIRQLESLTPVQKGKISKIIKDSREESIPLSRRLRELREATYGEDSGVSKEKERSPEAIQLKKQLHAIKKEAWQKMQAILTARQKAKLLSEREEEIGPRRRNNSAARPNIGK